MKSKNIFLVVLLCLMNFSVFAQKNTAKKNDTLIFEGNLTEARQYSRDNVSQVIKLTGSSKYKSHLLDTAKDAQAIIKSLSNGKVIPSIYIEYDDEMEKGIALTSIACGSTYVRSGEDVFDIGNLKKEDFTKFLIHYLKARKAALVELKN